VIPQLLGGCALKPMSKPQLIIHTYMTIVYRFVQCSWGSVLALCYKCSTIICTVQLRNNSYLRSCCCLNLRFPSSRGFGDGRITRFVCTFKECIVKEFDRIIWVQQHQEGSETKNGPRLSHTSAKIQTFIEEFESWTSTVRQYQQWCPFGHHAERFAEQFVMYRLRN